MSKVTQYGVARGESVIGETFQDVDTAKRHLAHIEDSMVSAGLEPDVRLITVEVTTTVGRPHVYKEPVEEDESTEEEPAPAE